MENQNNETIIMEGLSPEDSIKMRSMNSCTLYLPLGEGNYREIRSPGNETKHTMGIIRTKMLFSMSKLRF